MTACGSGRSISEAFADPQIHTAALELSQDTHRLLGELGYEASTINALGQRVRLADSAIG